MFKSFLFIIFDVINCNFCFCVSLQKSLEFEDLGPKRIAALEKEAEEWRMKAEDAAASIQDITVTYFEQTSKALAGTKGCLFHFCIDNDFFFYLL